MFVVGRQRVGKTVFLNVLAQYGREHGADFEIWDADISNASNNLSACIRRRNRRRRATPTRRKRGLNGRLIS